MGDGHAYTHITQVAELEAMDMLLFPSLKITETFGIVNIEAMAMHLPLVTLGVPASTDYAVHATNSLVCDESPSPQCIADKVLELLADPARACRMGDAGREQVRRLFGNERTRSKYLALYSCLSLCASLDDRRCAEQCASGR